MQWGDKVDFLKDVYEETGVIPPALANRPAMNSIWHWPNSVWRELTGSRQKFDGVPPLLSFSEIAVYGLVHGCSKSEIADLWHDVHLIDKVWQTEVAKIQEAQA